MKVRVLAALAACALVSACAPADLGVDMVAFEKWATRRGAATDAQRTEMARLYDEGQIHAISECAPLYDSKAKPVDYGTYRMIKDLCLKG